MITDDYVMEASGMGRKETWFVPLTTTGKSYPDALTTRMSCKVDFPTNLCCACGEPQPAILEEIELSEWSWTGTHSFPYTKETQLVVKVPICRKCAERIKGKENWSMPWKKIGTWDRIKARRELTKLIQVNTLPQHPQWLKVTLANKRYSEAFKAVNPSAQRNSDTFRFLTIFAKYECQAR